MLIKEWKNPATAGNALKVVLWPLLTMAVLVGLAFAGAYLANHTMTPHQHAAPAPSHLTAPR